MTIEQLYTIIGERINEKPEGSYTASLFASGIDRMAQKVGEEGVEVVIAAKNDDAQLLKGEVADLWYHLLVLMRAKGVTIEEVQDELGRRHNETA